MAKAAGPWQTAADCDTAPEFCESSSAVHSDAFAGLVGSVQGEPDSIALEVVLGFKDAANASLPNIQSVSVIDHTRLVGHSTLGPYWGIFGRMSYLWS